MYTHVHCTTQQEWDRAAFLLGRTSDTPYKMFGDKISLFYPNCSTFDLGPGDNAVDFGSFTTMYDQHKFRSQEVPQKSKIAKLRVVKTIPAGNDGYPTPTIPAGTETWARTPLSRLGLVVLENNQYYSNYPLSFFEITEYEGIKVGDVFTARELDSWSKENANEYTSAHGWSVSIVSLGISRSIESIEVLDKTVVFGISGTLGLYIRAEGFSKHVARLRKEVGSESPKVGESEEDLAEPSLECLSQSQPTQDSLPAYVRCVSLHLPDGSKAIAGTIGKIYKVKGQTFGGQDYYLEGLPYSVDKSRFEPFEWTVPMSEKFITVRKVDLKVIRNQACQKWRTRIDKAVEASDMWEDTIQVAYEEVLEGYSEARRKLRALLEHYFDIPAIQEVSSHDLLIGEVMETSQGVFLMRTHSNLVDIKDPKKYWELSAEFKGKKVPSGTEITIKVR